LAGQITVHSSHAGSQTLKL